MGDVYHAIDTTLGRAVAIKILSERHRDNQELRGRFVREARAVAAISHPNVVQVFTTGVFDDKPYLAMELLHGVDLATAVDRKGPWTSLATARAILDAARGLDAAARAGLIHRDVKPSNLMQLAHGAVKVTDFGLAKPIDPGAEPVLTALGVVVGTPDYIAPEQARGEPIDARVDIYALGGTTYFMLTGSPPYRTGDRSEDQYLKVVARHLRSPIPDARAVAATADGPLAELTMNMMAKRASDRPSFAQVIAWLEDVVARLEGSPARAAASGAVTRTAAKPSRPTPVAGYGVATDRDAARDPREARSPVSAVSLHDASASWTMPPERASRVLVGATILAALVFVSGLALVLAGPMPAPAGPPPMATATTTQAARSPAPPAGMLLVTHPDGRPWLFVAARPVTAAELAARDSVPAASGRADAPALRVSYARAQAYAAAQHARLATMRELRAAALTERFRLPARAAWEWTGDPPVRGKRWVRAARGKSATRAPTPHDDVTFRLARDLP